MPPTPEPTQTVAMLGLGIMGSALARHLLAAGFSVRGFDPNANAMQQAADIGVIETFTPVDAVHGAEFIVTSLPSEEALTATIDALENAADEVQDNSVLVELSTLSLECKSEAHVRCAEIGLEMLDCPVSGTGAQAQTRDIVLYASGDEQAFNACQVVFEAVARESFYLGSFGNGTRMKFIANLLVAIHNVASAEAIALAEQSGLDPKQVYDVISSGAGTSRIFELRGPMMVQETYTPATMKLDVWQKDMALIANFAKSLKAETPLFDVTKPLYEAANAAGLGEQDTAAVLEILKRQPYK